MPCSSWITSEMLPEIHTMEKCYFLKPIIHSQIILFSVVGADSFGVSTCQLLSYDVKRLSECTHKVSQKVVPLFDVFYLLCNYQCGTGYIL